ncbi:MAG TPA: metal-binding protein [Kouleothrix sp.]|uniref:metal-binding protein n=1 Tax=Kouleothrix sp. TaxID=2779161 RepID=UPI002C14EE07|nr:metal-binding protein [Kouleothrix sp.]HRC75317.1 metal-binding protein [Kouleothrix sp.]
MPGAHTHDAITVATGVALAPLAYTTNLALGESADSALRLTALFVGAHLLSGIMFSPDLDLDSAIDNRWGVFYWIWRPYMWAVPHRSRWLSHGLVIPPLLRLLYFYWVLIGLLIGGAWLLGHAGIAVPDLASRVGDVVLGTVVRYPRATWAFLLGFITGSAAHSIADWTVTGGKHYLRQLGFRITRDYGDHDHYRPYGRRRARF